MPFKALKGARRGLLAAALFLLLASRAQAISVSISDNVLVLSERQRSGQIELLSMTPSPVEFSIAEADLPEGVKSGAAYLRWAPQRTRVEGNRSVPLRVVFRPPPDLPPGEYIVRLGVKSREVNYRPPFAAAAENSDESVENGLAVGVAIQPVLPVTVYLRHRVDSPALQVDGFVPTPDDPERLGYFHVSKVPGAISYIGTVAAIDEASGAELARGRLRVGQTIDEKKVHIPRPRDREGSGGAVCLKLWPSFPARGEPEQVVCGD